MWVSGLVWKLSPINNNQSSIGAEKNACLLNKRRLWLRIFRCSFNAQEFACLVKNRSSLNLWLNYSGFASGKHFPQDEFRQLEWFKKANKWRRSSLAFVPDRGFSPFHEWENICSDLLRLKGTFLFSFVN